MSYQALMGRGQPTPGPEENPNPDSWADQSPSHIFYAYDKTVLL